MRLEMRGCHASLPESAYLLVVLKRLLTYKKPQLNGVVFYLVLPRIEMLAQAKLNFKNRRF